jgi:branched-chain amino acid transport system permease protein
MIEKQISRRGRKLAKPAVYGGIVIILTLLPLFIKSSYWLHVLILTLIYIIVTASFRLIAISGQFSLAHAAFMGIGAYTSAVLSRWFGWSVWLTIPLGALAAMVIGALIGYPFARLRAVYYALVSLFFGIGVLQIINALGIWTGSYQGLTGIPPLFGASKIPYYYFFLGLTSLCLLVMYRLEFCRIGTTLKAIAQSYLVAGSVGVNEVRYRILVLAIGCFFAGLAGAGYAQYNLVLSNLSFNFMATLWIVMYAIIGGLNSFAGPIIGAAVLIIIPEFARDLKMYTPYVAAALLLIVVYVIPQGLAGLPEVIRSWYIRRKAKKVSHAS